MCVRPSLEVGRGGDNVGGNGVGGGSGDGITVAGRRRVLRVREAPKCSETAHLSTVVEPI